MTASTGFLVSRTRPSPQIKGRRQLHPRRGGCGTVDRRVILTNGEVDAVAGLLSLREGSPFTIHAHPRVLATLRANSIFNVLDVALVRREPVALDQAFEPRLPGGAASGLEILPFAVPGKRAWYLEGEDDPAEADEPGDTIGLRIADTRSGAHFYFLAACAAVMPALAQRLTGAPWCSSTDAVQTTSWSRPGSGRKTGRRMGHMADVRADCAIAALADLALAKIFLHINNSNPVLRPGLQSAPRGRAAGWEIPRTVWSRAVIATSGFRCRKERRSPARTISKQRCGRSAPRGITTCIRSTACCTAAN